jgi:hypothetical protein
MATPPSSVLSVQFFPFRGVTPEFARTLRLLVEPINFDQLVADGVLVKRGASWVVKVASKLPEHAWKQAYSPLGGKPGELLLKFRKPKASLVRRVKLILSRLQNDHPDEP